MTSKKVALPLADGRAAGLLGVIGPYQPGVTSVPTAAVRGDRDVTVLGLRVGPARPGGRQA
jgi:hypothetical protein